MKFDIVIFGGGLAGAALAVALRASRFSVALVESNPPAAVSGLDARVYAISPANQVFLDGLGIWSFIPRERKTPVSKMSIFGDAGGQLGFSAFDAGLSELAWIVESSVIQRELWQALTRQHNVTLFSPAEPVKLTFAEDNVSVELYDSTVLSARLVVAADGANSWVRSQVGINARFQPYEQLGIVANLRCSRSHRDTAYQWFSNDGVVALLPMSSNIASLVWSAPEGVARSLLVLEDSDFCQRVQNATCDVLGEMQLLGPRAAFPLRLMRVSELVRPRVALIGDAAHLIHPLSGHGINLGFQDSKALSDRLANIADWEDPGDLAVLRGYARARAEEPLLMQYTTHALSRLFSVKQPFVRTLRNFGMNLTERLPVLRNALVGYATGRDS